MLVACSPAPVLNPNKPAKRAAKTEVDLTLSVAPETVVQTRDGSRFDLGNLWARQKVVVVFYQGGWCPHCAKQLATLQSHSKDFTDAKAVVVGISNESGADATALRDKLSLTFELYSDPDLTAITTWGVEDFGAGSARPATFVIEPGGTISYRRVGDKSGNHPSVDELLDALR